MQQNLSKINKPVIYFLFDGSRRKKAVNGDLPLLADAPRPLPSLSVSGRVPVGIVYDDSIRPRQINPQPSHTRGEEKDKDGVIL